MRLDQNPVFRKAIVPWYDSDAACFIVIICMGLVLLFGFTGFSVARENADYHTYIWVPGILVAMSIGVIFSTVIRLTKRYIRRYSK
jgi:ATP/ADP translocase